MKRFVQGFADLVFPPRCMACGIPLTGVGVCYESVLLDAIHVFKYKGKITTCEVLGKIMAVYFFQCFSIADYSLIIPVPLHPKRLRKPRVISKRLSIPLDFLILRRHVFKEPQVNLGKDQRTANARDAFAVKNGRK